LGRRISYKVWLFVNFSGIEHWPDEDRRWEVAATVSCKKNDLMDAK
jgi:hypothetical protein